MRRGSVARGGPLRRHRPANVRNWCSELLPGVSPAPPAPGQRRCKHQWQGEQNQMSAAENVQHEAQRRRSSEDQEHRHQPHADLVRRRGLGSQPTDACWRLGFLNC